MTARLFVLIVGLLSAACSLQAQEAKAELFEPASLWGKDRMSFHKHFRLYNGQNHYRIDYIQWKNRGSQPPKTTLMLVEPLKFGNFSRPIDFMNIRINGIALKDIEPIAEGIGTFKNGDLAGCTIPMDFDGNLVTLEFYMTKDSPLLFTRIKYSDQSESELKQGTVEINAVPSGVKKKPSGSYIYGGAYHREAATALTVYKTAYREQPVRPEDRYLILQDAELKAPMKDVWGPCLVAFDPLKKQNMLLRMRDSWLTTVIFKLDSAQKECSFAVWQGLKACENEKMAEFAKNLKFHALPEKP